MSRFFRSAVIAAAFALLAAPVWGQSARRPPAGNGQVRSQQMSLESDEAQVFLEAVQLILGHHASAPTDSTLWTSATDWLIEQLDDPYATVFTAAEYGQFTESNTGNYAGIGVQISPLGGRVTVTAVFRDTPAEGVGMIVGDRIVWVEGHDATEWTLDQARDSIRGRPGSVVQLRVARDGFEDPIPMAIVRDSVHVAAVAATHIDDVAHFAVDRIARGVSAELDTALRDYADARALILDLRRNPGGYLDESLRVADLFLAPGQTLASADVRSQMGTVERQAWTARTPPRIPGMPIIILVNEYTASAAEIIAGALQDHDRAVVVGQRTFGKGVVQTVFPLPADRRMRITTGSWYTPLGRSLHRLRHRDGTLREEGEEERETVATPAGRELETGGGIFPDLEVVADTLKEEERALLNHANQVRVPIDIRIEEYAFELAKDALATGRVDRLPTPAFDDLARGLVEAGMDTAIVNDPVARSYLDWRTQSRYLYRADSRGLALTVQAERDRVLAEALRLARSAATPAELFARVGQAGSQPTGR